MFGISIDCRIKMFIDNLLEALPANEANGKIKSNQFKYSCIIHNKFL